MKRFASYLIMLIVSVCSVFSQTDTVISFVNIYPGHEIYELEGHSALRINMGPQADIAINYGEFDFNAPNFVYRFIKGETDYRVGAMPWSVFLGHYRHEQRRVVEHILDLTPEQKRRLIDLLSENLRPENRTYRYNYVKDNCATRPLHIIELAVGDTISLGATSWDEKSHSYRDVFNHFHANYPWYQFGIDLCLGSGIDYPLNRREYSFAPAILDKQLNGATVSGRPLALSSRATLDFAEDGAIEGPTPWPLKPIAAAWIVFALFYLLTIKDQRQKKITRWADALLFGIFGLEGLILTFLIFVSVHEATSPNWLYLWLNPLCLLIPVLIWLKKCKIFVLSYHFANFVALIALCLIWICEVQALNPAFLPLIWAGAMRSASYIRLNFKKPNAAQIST